MSEPQWGEQMPTNTIQHSILRIGIPGVVVLLAALAGALLLRDMTVKAEAAHIAERFVLSDDAAEDAGELRAQLIHCDISVPAALSIALETAFTARPSAYRRGFDEAYLRFALVDCNALERTAKNYTG
jgi:hypothetical protein